MKVSFKVAQSPCLAWGWYDIHVHCTLYDMLWYFIYPHNTDEYKSRLNMNVPNINSIHIKTF